MKNKVFKFYSDPGHGWMAVKIKELITLGILQKISPYSYIKGKTVYLEEDMDMSTFFDAYREKFGYNPRYENKIIDNLSPIRSYERFMLSCVD